MASPRLDANRHRGAPGSDQLIVSAHLVIDEDRFMKDHAVDSDRRASAPRPLRRQTAAGEIYFESSLPPKVSPFGLASAGIAMTRTSGGVPGKRI